MSVYKSILFVRSNIDKFETNGQLHSYPTRSMHNLRTVPHRTTAFEKSAGYAGARFFNEIPDSIKSLESLKLFKKRLKEYLIDKCAYAVSEL